MRLNAWYGKPGSSYCSGWNSTQRSGATAGSSSGQSAKLAASVRSHGSGQDCQRSMASPTPAASASASVQPAPPLAGGSAPSAGRGAVPDQIATSGSCASRCTAPDSMNKPVYGLLYQSRFNSGRHIRDTPDRQKPGAT